MNLSMKIAKTLILLLLGGGVGLIVSVITMDEDTLVPVAFIYGILSIVSSIVLMSYV